MKHLILILLMTLTFSSSFAQEEVSVVTTPELQDISTVEQTIVYYTKDFIEGTKKVGGAAIDLVDQGIDMIISEGTIIVKQYLMYMAIQHGIPVLIAFILIFYLAKKLHRIFSVDKEDAEEHNDKIDTAIAASQNEEKEVDNWKDTTSVLETKYIKFLDIYYRNPIQVGLAWVVSLLPLLVGIYLLLEHLMIFIKISIFPKLYLAELVMQYLKINV